MGLQSEYSLFLHTYKRLSQSKIPSQLLEITGHLPSHPLFLLTGKRLRKDEIDSHV